MARTWLSVRVDLISGHREDFWPRPGRIFAASRRHTFAQWPPPSMTHSPAGTAPTYTNSTCSPTRAPPSPSADRTGTTKSDDLLDDRHVTLGRLSAGDQFVYEFDFGDAWTHLRTVGPVSMDPLEQLGIVPDQPLPYSVRGTIPDQYARRRDGDDGEPDSHPGPDPQLHDLPALRPYWGARQGLGKVDLVVI